MVSNRRHFEAVLFERDRRYTELAAERERALGIKDKADETALLLASQIRDYKDEQANNLREQISSERGSFATKDDLVAAVEKLGETMKPLIDFVSSTQGRSLGIGLTGRTVVGVATVLGIIITAVVVLANVLTH